MIFSQSSGLYTCPLSMTDGASFTLRALRWKRQLIPDALKEAEDGLISNDPDKFWNSG
mgnify:FL=1